MATNVRAFNGTTARITLALGTVGVYGPGTALALVFPSSTGAPQTALSTGDSNSVGLMLQVDTKVYCRVDGTEVHGSALMTASHWYLVAAAKATGTATPRLHVYDCDAGTWTHENASGTRPNSSAPATRQQIGSNALQTGAFFTGSIQLVAFWSSVLDDTAVAALTSLSAIIAAAPDALWILDQAATTDAVLDYTGHGADQTALTATTVGSATIPNFDMSYPATLGRVYKRFYGPALLGNSAADLYTCPASTRARILGIHASNPSGSPVDLTLSVGADGAATRVYDGCSLAADQTLERFDPYDLAAGEKIQGFAGSAATVNLTITGWEQPA